MRLAVPADAPAVAALLARAFADFRARYTEAAFAATISSAEGVLARIDEGPVWVVDGDDGIVGTFAAVERDGACYLRGMGVDPGARGRGIGRALIDAAIAHANGRRLLLSTTPFLDAAIRLYEAAGFVRTDDPPHELHGTRLFTMIRE